MSWMSKSDGYLKRWWIPRWIYLIVVYEVCLYWCKLYTGSTGHFSGSRAGKSYNNGPIMFKQIIKQIQFHRIICFWMCFSLFGDHNDVIKSIHFPRCRLFVRGSHRSPLTSPHKGQWRGALMFSLIYAWTNSWANNGDAGDLRDHRAHCGAIVTEGEWMSYSGILSYESHFLNRATIWTPLNHCVYFHCYILLNVYM